jgi:transcriptional regulator with XRE-family HTH domain
MSFAERLRELREKAGLTQQQLADSAGLHRLGIAKLEQGVRQPSWATVESLARALRVRCTAFEGTSALPGETAAPEPAEGKKKGRPRKKGEHHE